MADHAAVLVEANGLGDVITIIKGKAEETELPEQVDLIISEPMGIALVNERMLESYIHVRKWLKPGGLMFPTTSFMYCAPFSDEQLYQEVSQRSHFFHNRDFFRVDLSSLQSVSANQAFKQPVVEAFDARLLLSQPTATELDYMTLTPEDLQEVVLPVHFAATSAATVHGFALWFDVVFDGSEERVILSTSPLSATTHWYQVRCLLRTPLVVARGQSVSGQIVMTANVRQSYDIEMDVVVDQTGKKSTGSIDLKDPYFRYMAASTPPQMNVPSTEEQFAAFAAEPVAADPAAAGSVPG